MGSCEQLSYVSQNISDYVRETLGERCQSPSIVIPTLFIYSVILILGVFGNVCTCIVIIANRSMHNPTNFYLFSLAISDILVLVLGLPMELHGVLDYAYPYMFGDIVCKARAFLIEFTSYASVLIICCFSVERWLAICYPLRVKLFSTISRAYFLILAAWIVSFLAALPMAFIVKINRLPIPDFAYGEPWLKLITNDGKTVKYTDFCAMDVEQPDQQSTLIYFAFFAFFLIPGMVITIMYSQIGLKLKNAGNLLEQEKSMTAKRGKSTRNVMKMLVSVVVTFFLCWLPFHLQRLLSLFMTYQQGNVSPAVQFVFTCVFYISGYCYYSNSACNPILYNILSVKFRRAFCRTILGEKWTRRIFPRWHERQQGNLWIKTNLDMSSLTKNGSMKRGESPSPALFRCETPKPILV